MYIPADARDGLNIEVEVGCWGRHGEERQSKESRKTRRARARARAKDVKSDDDDLSGRESLAPRGVPTLPEPKIRLAKSKTRR